jgi:hypothetical protein
MIHVPLPFIFGALLDTESMSLRFKRPQQKGENLRGGRGSLWGGGDKIIVDVEGFGDEISKEARADMKICNNIIIIRVDSHEIPYAKTA